MSKPRVKLTAATPSLIGRLSNQFSSRRKRLQGWLTRLLSRGVQWIGRKMPARIRALGRRVQRWLLQLRPETIIRLRTAIYVLGLAAVIGLVPGSVANATYNLIDLGMRTKLPHPVIRDNEDGTWSKYVNLCPAPVIALLANDNSTSGTINGMAPFFLNMSIQVTDPGDGTWKQMWHLTDFDDDATHVGTTVGHDYVSPGTHNPSSTSRNAAGNETTATQEVVVAANTRTAVHVDYDAAPGGDGSVGTPFDSLDDVTEADAIDIIITAGTTATGTLTGTLTFTTSHNNVRIRSATAETQVDIDVRVGLAMAFAGDNCRIEDVRFMSGITSLTFNGAVRMDEATNLLALRVNCDETMFQHSHSAFFVNSGASTGRQGLSLVDTTSTCPAGVTSRNGNNGYTIQFACEHQFYCNGCTFTEGNSRVMRIVCDQMGIYNSTWEQASTETSGVGNVITFEGCNHVWSFNNSYINAALDSGSSILNLSHDVSTSTNMVFCRDLLDAAGADNDRFGAMTFGGNTALVQELLVIHCVFRECQFQRGSSSSAHDEIDVLFNTLTHTRQYNGVMSGLQVGITNGARWVFGGNLHTNTHASYAYSPAQGFSGAIDVSVPETSGGGAADLTAAWGDGTEQRVWGNSVQTSTSVPSGTGDAAMWYNWPSNRDVFNFGMATDFNDEAFADGNARGSVALEANFRPSTPGSAPTSNSNRPGWVDTNFGFDHYGATRPAGAWLRGAVDVLYEEVEFSPTAQSFDVGTRLPSCRFRVTHANDDAVTLIQITDQGGGVFRFNVTKGATSDFVTIGTGATAETLGDLIDWVHTTFTGLEVDYAGGDIGLTYNLDNMQFAHTVVEDTVDDPRLLPGQTAFVASGESPASESQVFPAWLTPGSGLGVGI